MIKYHGTPITPIKIFKENMANRNVLVSYARLDDFQRAIKICKKIMLDNGAFTFWKKKVAINWNDYYKFVSDNYEKIDYFIIPDVIDGSEEENDYLIDEYLKKYSHSDKGLPVWHIHESLERLRKLIKIFSYICIGSSGKFSTLGTRKWHKRMNEAMKIVCDEDGFPKVKIHMLRCLNPKIFTLYPFFSGDSTNVARNHSKRTAETIIKGIEKYASPKKYIFKKDLMKLSGV